MPSHRLSTSQAGYGHYHRKLRRMLDAQVKAGLALCWRCTHQIKPHEPWDLGHDDDDRGRYRGPEHRHCNRSAAATRGNKARVTRTSRDWFKGIGASESRRSAARTKTPTRGTSPPDTTWGDSGG